jgi:hypothetical protein
MSKLARPLMLVAMLAAMNLAAMAAVAQAHTSNDSASTRHRTLGRVGFLATDQPSGQADATVRRLLARERSTKPGEAPTHPRLLLDEERSSLLNIPNRDATRTALAQERYYSTWGYGGASAPAAPAEPSGQPAWLVIALAVLAAVLALVAGVAVLAARRATRSQHAGQTA